MSELADLTESLKRAVAVPGEFRAVFASTTDTDLEEMLLDAFAEAQLFGFFGQHSATDEGLVSPDLSRGEGALVVIFAMCRMLAAEIRNRKTHVRYEASGSVFEQDQTASTLVQLLKDYQLQKAELLKRAGTGAASAFYMADQYVARAAENNNAVSFGL